MRKPQAEEISLAVCAFNGKSYALQINQALIWANNTKACAFEHHNLVIYIQMVDLFTTWIDLDVLNSLLDLGGRIALAHLNVRRIELFMRSIKHAVVTRH